MCVCACCYQPLSSKISDQGPVAIQDSRQGSHEGLYWKKPLVLNAAGWDWFPPGWRHISQGTSAAIHNFTAQHTACTNPIRSLASHTVTLKSAHAQWKMCTGEDGISLFGCWQRVFFWKCFRKKMWCRVPDGKLVVLWSTFTLPQRLCKAGMKTDPELLYATSIEKLMVPTGSLQCSIRRRCLLSFFLWGKWVLEGNMLFNRTCICTYNHISKIDTAVYFMSIHRAASADCKL